MHVQGIALAVASFLARELQVVILFVLHVQIRRAERHRAIHVNRQARNPLLVLQLPQVVHERLRPPDGERRNHDRPAALCHTIHDLRQQFRGIAFGMLPITVC